MYTTAVSHFLLLPSEPWLRMLVLAIRIITTHKLTLFVSATITPVGRARLSRPQQAFLAQVQHNITLGYQLASFRWHQSVLYLQCGDVGYDDDGIN
jgi:hypothetical protein